MGTTGEVSYKFVTPKTPDEVEFIVYEAISNTVVKTDRGNSFKLVPTATKIKEVANIAKDVEEEKPPMMYYVYVDVKNLGDKDVDVKYTRNGKPVTFRVRRNGRGFARFNFMSIQSPQNILFT